MRCVVGLVLAIQSSLAIAQLPSTQPLRSASMIKEMIEGLGDDDFLLRQRSSEQLLSAGSSAIESLRSATQSLDPEVSHRANDILKTLLETDLEQRGKRFVAMDQVSNENFGFKHWNSFSLLAGDNAAGRSLLVAIYSNPNSKELLTGIDRERNSLRFPAGNQKAEPLDDRSVTASVVVYAAEMYRRSIRLRTLTAAEKPLLSSDGVVEELTTSAFESKFLSLSPITVQQSQHKEAFRTLLTAWLKLELKSSPMTVAKLKIITSHCLSTCADEITAVLNHRAYPHKQAAIESLSRIFCMLDDQGQSTLVQSDDVDGVITKQLEPYIFSSEILLRLPLSQTKGPVEVTLGDFAFQLLVDVRKKDPTEFGMTKSGGTRLLDNRPVFAFKTRAAASEAKKEWMSNLATKKNEARKK